MELHSYAKTRAPKKWTIELKRKLVENRITLDVLFNKKSFNLIDSWKKLMKVSSLESFDLLFIRKQWTNILSKYKILAQRHISDTKTEINEETIDMITADWEFFDQIYRWIKYKEKQSQNNSINIITEEIELTKQKLPKELLSDDEETITTAEPIIFKEQLQNNHPKILLINTQKNNNNNNNNNSNNKNSIPNSSQQYQNNDNNHHHQINNPIHITTIHSAFGGGNDVTKKMNEIQKIDNSRKIINDFNNSSNSMEITTNLDKKSIKIKKKKSKKFKNYHEHQRTKKANKKIDKKINAFCQIFAQIVHKDYPDINVNELLSDNDKSIESTSSSD